MFIQLLIDVLYHFKLRSVDQIGRLSCDISNSGRILILQLPVFVIVSVSYDQIEFWYTGLGENPFKLIYEGELDTQAWI